MTRDLSKTFAPIELSPQPMSGASGPTDPAAAFGAPGSEPGTHLPPTEPMPIGSPPPAIEAVLRPPVPDWGHPTVIDVLQVPDTDVPGQPRDGLGRWAEK